MRFLFVYEDFAAPTRDLLAELAVSDVRIIIARRGEVEPRPGDRRLLEANEGAEAAACQINRRYRKAVVPYVRFTVEPKKFRVDDKQLREWLVGGEENPAERAAGPPADAFTDAAAASPGLRLHAQALSVADQLDESRWTFAAKAARMLGRLGSGDPDLEPLRNWEAAYGLKFAVSGQVSYSYSSVLGGKRHSVDSEWHLKAGDRTTRERAARIYFTQIKSGEEMRVLVAYVGPHPPDGAYSADFGDHG